MKSTLKMESALDAMKGTILTTSTVLRWIRCVRRPITMESVQGVIRTM